MEHWRTTKPKPATPNREQRPTEGKNTQHTPTHTSLGQRRARKEKKTQRRNPNERGTGDGDHETQDRDNQGRTPQSHNTTGPKSTPPLQLGKKEQKGRRWDKPHPRQLPHTPTPQVAHPKKETGNARGTHKRPRAPAPKPGKNRRADETKTHNHTHTTPPGMAG